MAVSYVSSAVALATTVTMPTHQAGDLLLMWAYRNNSNTAATLPAGWINLNNSGANTNSGRLAYKWAQSSSETSGTWTNTSSLTVMVYRGAGGVGVPTVNGGTGTTLTYPALTLFRTNSTSWVARFGGHRTAADMTTNTVSGYTYRNGSSVSCQGCDSNGGLSSNPTTGTQAVSASSGWRTVSVEIKAEAPSKFDTLTDDFNTGSSPDAAKWSNWGGANVTLSSSELQIDTGTASGGYYGMDSLTEYDLTSSYAGVKVVTAGTPLTTYGLYPVQVSLDDSYAYYWYINNGTAYSYKVVAGTYTSINSRTHTDGDWYRIRESSGTIVFEYGTTGSSWTTLGTPATAQMPVISMGLSIFTETTGIITAQTPHLDNFNVYPGGGTTGQIKVWNGSAWVAKPVKVWNGSSWVTKPVKVWNGSAWVATNY